MYRRTLAGKVLIAARASGVWKEVSSVASLGRACVVATPDRSLIQQGLSQQVIQQGSLEAAIGTPIKSYCFQSNGALEQRMNPS